MWPRRCNRNLANQVRFNQVAVLLCGEGQAVTESPELLFYGASTAKVISIMTPWCGRDKRHIQMLDLLKSDGRSKSATPVRTFAGYETTFWPYDMQVPVAERL